MSRTAFPSLLEEGEVPCRLLMKHKTDASTMHRYLYDEAGQVEVYSRRAELTPAASLLPLGEGP